MGDRVRDRRGAERTGLGSHLARCVLIARANGVEILDGVEANLQDMDGFAAACRHGRAMGFTGKTVIHPNQIEPANEVFGVTPEQVSHAVKVVEAWKKNEKTGEGVMVLDGRLVERLHYDRALRVLAMNRVIGNRKA